MSHQSAKKNDQGKLRYDLIPPECLRELARVYTIGAQKYADDNWKNGLERKRIEAALFRHFEAARSGEVTDPEDGQRHLASVAWCAFSLMWYDMQAEAEEEDDTKDALRQVEEAGAEPIKWATLEELRKNPPPVLVHCHYDGCLWLGADRQAHYETAHSVRACPSAVGGRVTD